MNTLLDNLKTRLTKINSQWNGEESGLSEDRAIASQEGIDYIDKLSNILKELDI
jgi:hypothetical protein